MTSEYDRGFADGAASRQVELDALERVADYWYFRALNPKAKTPEQIMVEDIIRGREANEERARVWSALDAAEREMFDQARALLAEGLSDIEVAKQVGLFLPIVANIRAGVL